MATSRLSKSKKEKSLICLCHSLLDGQTRPVELLDLDGREVFVQGCGKPHKIHFNKYTRRCENCLSLYSSPWELLCVPCYRATPVEERPHDGPYRGWRWAARRYLEKLDSIRVGTYLVESLETP